MGNVATEINNLNFDLNSIHEYVTNHGLRLNTTKSVALCIGSKKQKDLIENRFSLSAGTIGGSIDWVISARNLGVYFDGHFTFSEHVNHIYKVTMFKLKTLYPFKFQFSSELKLTLIKTLIFPSMEYCCALYYNYLPQYNKDKLQRIQNSCLRFVDNIPYRDHISPYLKNREILCVDGRMQYLISMFLYKIYKTKSPTYLFNIISKRSDVHNINIRTNTFSIPKYSTSKFKGSFSYSVPYYYI